MLNHLVPFRDSHPINFFKVTKLMLCPKELHLKEKSRGVETIRRQLNSERRRLKILGPSHEASFGLRRRLSSSNALGKIMAVETV
jgi:hypothetical protein